MSILQRIAADRLKQATAERLVRSAVHWNRIRLLWAATGGVAAYMMAGQPPVEALAQVAAEPWDIEKGHPFVGRELKIAHEPPDYCYKTAERATRLVKHSSEHARAAVSGIVKPFVEKDLP